MSDVHPDLMSERQRAAWARRQEVLAEMVLGASPSELAERFGVTPQAISEVAARRGLSYRRSRGYRLAMAEQLRLARRAYAEQALQADPQATLDDVAIRLEVSVHELQTLLPPSFRWRVRRLPSTRRYDQAAPWGAKSPNAWSRALGRVPVLPRTRKRRGSL